MGRTLQMLALCFSPLCRLSHGPEQTGAGAQQRDLVAVRVRIKGVAASRGLLAKSDVKYHIIYFLIRCLSL